MWQILRAKIFDRQYKNLGSVRQEIVDKALIILSESENPADLGEYKSNLRVWSYELNRHDRIVYRIEYKENIIHLLRVCDHKSVFGKD
ncbi:hypothetical protein SU86_009130 [Candidatus Nitrosotenuis cloacae]|uniref:Addiction module toxin RelE n=1 Tax=Candidatus Nitrosotenuis cloacae TaxID=1603555 RepID=A0A3G1B3P8_9ARCH|nr:hypothetical protein SU86_009130 [Candidatus Nitrosotenuis cloacae]